MHLTQKRQSKTFNTYESRIIAKGLKHQLVKSVKISCAITFYSFRVTRDLIQWKGLKASRCHKLENLFAVKSIFTMGNLALLERKKREKGKKKFNDRKIFILFLCANDGVFVRCEYPRRHIKNCRGAISSFLHTSS